MGHNWYPLKESDLLIYAQNWVTLGGGTPANFAWVAGDVTALSPLVTSFSTNLNLASNSSTRTPSIVAAKDVSKAGMLAQMKIMKRKTDAASPPITAQHREDLNLPPKDVTPTPVPVPSGRPVISVLSMSNRAVSVKLKDEEHPTRRARPTGVSGTQVFSIQAANPPSNLDLWQFEGLATRPDFLVSFPDSATAGTKVWICARYYNSKGETGPMSEAVTAFIVEGIAAA